MRRTSIIEAVESRLLFYALPTTEILRDIAPGSTDGAVPDRLGALVALDSERSCFVATDATHGYELWITDSTPTGTRLLKDINPGAGDSSPSGFKNVNGVLFFVADDGVHSTELWKTDGTAAGTGMVKDITTSPNGSGISSMIELDGKVCFIARSENMLLGSWVWTSDGTAAGTEEIVPEGGIPEWAGNPICLTEFGGQALFVAGGDDFNVQHFWRTDGTSAGTTRWFRFESGFTPNSIEVVRGRMYLDFGEMWQSDGTTAGTFSIESKAHAQMSITEIRAVLPRRIICTGKVVYQSSPGFSRWSEETVISADINGGDVQVLFPVNPGPTAPNSFAKVGNFAYFTANDPVHGEEYWRTDGTKKGTTLVADAVPGPSSSNVLTRIRYNDRLYYINNDFSGAGSSSLWTTDGTAAGTVKVTDFPNAKAGNGADIWGDVEGLMLLLVTTSTDGQEPWVSDGTKAGTRRLFDINPGAASSDLSAGEMIGHTLVYAARDAAHGMEMWRTTFAEAGVSGVAFIDRNNNGRLDTGEKRIAGMRVWLDEDRNGKRTRGEPSNTTDSAGNYHFSHLSGGQRDLRFDLPNGYRAPRGPSAALTTLPGDAVRRHLAFVTTAQISGTVFRDNDRDAQRDVGESSLGGWKIYIDLDDDGVFDATEISTTSAADGSFTFTNLQAGTYKLRLMPVSGWRETSRDIGSRITLVAGAKVTGIVLGAKRLTS